MSEAIVRSVDWDQCGYGLHLRYICGLNIFEENLSEEEEERQPDPRVEFLRSIALCHPCSAHVGLDEWGFDPEDMDGYLRDAPEAAEWSPTPVTLFDELVYPVRGVGGHFSGSSVPLSLLDRCGRDLLSYSQLALYVGASDRALSEITHLLQPPNALSPSISESRQYDSQYVREWYRLRGGQETLSKDNETKAFTGEWLRKICDLYSLVVIPGHDGVDFDVYTRDSGHFDLIAGPIADAVRMIESSRWYQEHRAELYWGERRRCLTLRE